MEIRKKSMFSIFLIMVLTSILMVPSICSADGGKPDLYSEGIGVEPYPFRAGDAIMVFSVIINGGEEDAPSSETAVFIDDELITIVDTPPLEKEEWWVLTTPVSWPDDTHSHALRIVVDFSDKIDEENEYNNEVSEIFRGFRSRILHNLFDTPLLGLLLKILSLRNIIF